MKTDKRKSALALRSKGFSIKEIATKLSVSKSSVSTWVRDVQLSFSQKEDLRLKGHSNEQVEKRRKTRLENSRLRREHAMSLAGNEIPKLSARDLHLLGVALYWGEGGKVFKNGIRLSNSDPDLIRVMMRFFRETCAVPEAKFRAHIHTFSHLNVTDAEMYWQKVTNIPAAQFFKTYAKPSKAGAGKRDSLPCGTVQIYVLDTQLFLRVMGWLQKIKNLLLV